MEQIRYKLTSEFFIVILVALAVAIIDIALYMAFPIKIEVLLIVAGVMIIVALRYMTATLATYITLDLNHIKVREYGPLNFVFKQIPHNQVDKIILVGQTLTIYYNSRKSIEVELGDMRPISALIFTEYLQNLNYEIKKPGDSKLVITQTNIQV